MHSTGGEKMGRWKEGTLELFEIGGGLFSSSENVYCMRIDGDNYGDFIDAGERGLYRVDGQKLYLDRGFQYSDDDQELNVNIVSSVEYINGQRVEGVESRYADSLDTQEAWLELFTSGTSAKMYSDNW